MTQPASNAKEIFLEAVEKAEPHKRVAFLDRACAGDAELRRRVEALLRANEGRDELLDRPAVEHLAKDLSDNSPALEEQAADSEVLDLLARSQKPGSLGRLAHYEVIQVIGRGGMGVVLRAFDEKLHRVVAIKVLTPHLAASGGARQRFVREARAAAAVTHENVIAIHSVEDTGPVPYLVMQCIDGKTLQDKLNACGSLDLKEILRIGFQIAEGLAAAHKQGLIHRDIKPANILLENGIERVKITDFGLARLADDASLTQSGCIAGTPLYMSPEQARDEKVDVRSDLFSLGSVLYAMCAGHAPFRASGSMAILKRVCEETPRPLREINPNLPEWLQSLIAKLQAKNPAQRYASAAEVAALLSQRLAQLQAGGAFHDAAAPVAKPSRDEQRPGNRRAVAAILLSTAIVAVGVSIAGWFAYQSWHSGREEANRPLEPRAPRAKETQAPVPTAAPAPELPVVLKPARTLLQHTAGVRTLAYSRDGAVLASGGLDKHIYLWDTKTWEARGPLEGHGGAVSGLAFSPDGVRLASVSSDPDNCLVRIWNVATGEQIETLGQGEQGMWDVAYSPDGQTLACGGWDNTLHLFDVATESERRTITGVTLRLLRGLSFSHDSRKIATGGSGPTRLWDPASGEEIATQSPLSEGMCPLFLPSGKGLAGWIYPEGRITLCDIPSGQVQADWRPYPRPYAIEGLAVSRDGRFLASIGNDGLAHIWSTADQSRVATLTGHQGAIFAVAFAPDGSWLATGGCDDFTIHIWALPPICRTVAP